VRNCVPAYTWVDSDVILSTIVNAAMLEVHLLQQCNVLNLLMLVLNYTPVELFTNNLGISIFSIPHLTPSFSYQVYLQNGGVL